MFVDCQIRAKLDMWHYCSNFNLVLFVSPSFLGNCIVYIWTIGIHQHVCKATENLVQDVNNKQHRRVKLLPLKIKDPSHNWTKFTSHANLFLLCAEQMQSALSQKICCTYISNNNRSETRILSGVVRQHLNGYRGAAKPRPWLGLFRSISIKLQDTLNPQAQESSTPYEIWEYNSATRCRRDACLFSSVRIYVPCGVISLHYLFLLLKKSVVASCMKFSTLTPREGFYDWFGLL